MFNVGKILFCFSKVCLIGKFQSAHVGRSSVLAGFVPFVVIPFAAVTISAFVMALCVAGAFPTLMGCASSIRFHGTTSHKSHKAKSQCVFHLLGKIGFEVRLVLRSFEDKFSLQVLLSPC